MRERRKEIGEKEGNGKQGGDIVGEGMKIFGLEILPAFPNFQFQILFNFLLDFFKKF